MKKTKPILWILAGAWLLLLMVEKTAATADSLSVRKRAWPIKAGHGGMRVMKSIILMSLAVVNIFMALSMVSNNCR
jgi:hypothetical protein